MKDVQKTEHKETPHTGRTIYDDLNYDDYHGENDTYHLNYTVPHTDSSVVIQFKGSGLQGITDESWGLDNVRVEVNVIPLPSTLLLLGTGLLGLAAGRRK